MNLDLTIAELDLYYSEIETSETVQEISNKFKKNPNSPGILLLENKRLIGAISQKKFWQYMSRPYSIEIAAKRSIKYLLEFINIDSLILSGDTSVVRAVRATLQGLDKSLEEPIIVKISPEEYRLLDVHQLLVAQAQIHELANELLIQTNRELHEANHKLERLSQLDDITKLTHRRVFEEYFERQWQDSLEQKTPLALIIFEIDFFTEYDRAFGSIASDNCLRQVANAIENVLKQPKYLATRYKDHEFAIIMPKTSVMYAAFLAEEIREHITSLKIDNPESPIREYVTLSMGVVSLIPTSANSSETLITAASRATYEAKQAGGNCKVISVMGSSQERGLFALSIDPSKGEKPHFTQTE
ncbi:MAG: diguanylate cyclase [Prochloraceae cyanobacterium]|nr:diguanylate cyclase [Prochloraceae cyanobacterium]